MTNQELITELRAALEAADLYLNSYDTSAPSRIKAETRWAVAHALEFSTITTERAAEIEASEKAWYGETDDWEGPATPEYSERDDEAYDEMIAQEHLDYDLYSRCRSVA